MNTKEKRAVGNIGYRSVFFMKNCLLNTLFCYFWYFYFWNINMSFVKKFIKKLIFFNFKSNFLEKVFYCVTKIYNLATIHGKMAALQHFLNFLRNSTLFAIHKKWSFPLRISSVDVIKYAGNCGFGHIYWRNL